MPRIADHDARRDQMARAAIDLALSDGISRVTVARVAASAGVSVGLVQHYFSSKHDLMTRVYEDVLARVDERVAEVVETGDSSGSSIRDMVVHALAELLPLDDGRRAECLVRAELETMAIRDPRLQQVAAQHGRALQARLGAVVGNAQRCGEAPPQTDVDQAAAVLWASVVGASQARLLDPGFRALEVVTDSARRVFPHPCRAHG